jgi:hypothetical protein
VLDDVGQRANDPTKSSHKRYRAVHRLLQDRDKQLAAAVDGPRRLTALIQLARI